MTTPTSDRVRSALFNCCILIDNGHDLDEALSLIEESHQLTVGERDQVEALLPGAVKRD